MAQIYRSLHYAFRILRRNPAFAVAAIGTMAVGIGAAVATFSMLDAVILRPLPYREPDRVVFLWENKRELKDERITVAPANYLDWQNSNHVFQDMALVKGVRYSLTTRDGDTHKVQGLSVSPNFFHLLGVAPQLGRIFSAEQKDAVILSDQTWRTEFDADPAIVGKTVDLGGRPHTILGVMPSDFYFQEFGAHWDLWTPLTLDAGEKTDRDAHCCGAIARLRSGVEIQQAQREMDQIAARLEQEFPKKNRGGGVRVVSARDQSDSGANRGLMIITAAVCLLLLIACSNVAMLLLVRSEARRKEMSMRVALGASRFDLVVQLLTESLVLVVIGGLAGMAIATSLLPLLRTIPVNLPRLNQITMDWRILGFSLAATLGTGMLFGLTPALTATRKSTGHSRKILCGFVIAEITLAFVLLTSTGLLVESLEQVLKTGSGFQPEQVLSATVTLPAVRYRNAESTLAFERDLRSKVQELPGTLTSGLTTNLPIGGTGWDIYFSIEGRPSGEDDVLGSAQRLVSPGYFETMEIPLLAGRTFHNQDNETAPPAAVINNVLKERYFPGQDPIGRRVKWGRLSDSDYPTWYTIVGVVGSVRDRTLEKPPTPELYMCLSQMAGPRAAFAPGSFSLVLRHEGSSSTLPRELRNSVRSLDSAVELTEIRTMDQVLSRSLTTRKFNLLIFILFAALALILAWIGIYGLISYFTSRRTREIGIRIALGAQPGAILHLVLKEGIVLTAVGVTAGAILSWLLVRFLSSLLFQVNPHSPLILIAAALFLTIAALAATCLPALRALQTNPNMALRLD